ncbi:unnamed protein product [Ilex paraguariensis]|uniref:Uncharacterized protein n=1 Tax=Ilex paraguariensis TaxID=185542 RepID=A0ABC8RTN4_9AQUA
MVRGDNARFHVHVIEDAVDTDVNMTDIGMSKSTPQHGWLDKATHPQAVNNGGRKLRVGYEQDAAEVRRQLNAKLAKIDGLTMDHRHKTGYKIASDSIKVDLFMSLPEYERLT